MSAHCHAESGWQCRHGEASLDAGGGRPAFRSHARRDFFARAARWSFSGKIGSNQLVVDDFKALAALAPQGPASSEPAASKPAGGDAAPSKPPGEKAGTSIPRRARYSRTSGGCGPGTRCRSFLERDRGADRCESEIGRYGRDYTIRDIRCAAAITETRLRSTASGASSRTKRSRLRRT